jgi:hypothetical protein
MDPNELIRYAQNPRVQIQAGKQLERKKKVPFLSRILALPIALGSIPDVIYNKDPLKYLKNVARGLDTTITGTKHSDLKTTTDLLKQANILQGKSLPSRIANLGVSLAGDIALDPTMYFSAPKALLKKDAIKIADDVAKQFTVSNKEKLIDKLSKRGVSAGVDELFKAGDISASSYLSKAVAKADVKEVKTLLSDIGEKKLTEDPKVATAVNMLLNPIAEGAGLIGKGANRYFPEQTEKLRKKFNSMFMLGRNAEDAGLGEEARHLYDILSHDTTGAARRKLEEKIATVGKGKPITKQQYNRIMKEFNVELKEMAKKSKVAEAVEDIVQPEKIEKVKEVLKTIDPIENAINRHKSSKVLYFDGRAYPFPEKISPNLPKDISKKYREMEEILNAGESQIKEEIMTKPSQKGYKNSKPFVDYIITPEGKTLYPAMLAEKEFDPDKLYDFDTVADSFAPPAKMNFLMKKGESITGRKSTLEAVGLGEKTSTARSYPLGKIGDIVEIEGELPVQIVNVRKIEKPLTDREFKALEKTENWTVDAMKGRINKSYEPGNYITYFRKLDKKGTHIPLTEIKPKLYSEGKGRLLSKDNIITLQKYMSRGEVKPDEIDEVLSAFRPTINKKATELASKFKKEMDPKTGEKISNVFDTENNLVDFLLRKFKSPTPALQKMIEEGNSQGIYNYVRKTLMMSGKEYADELLGRTAAAKKVLSETESTFATKAGGEDPLQELIDAMEGNKNIVLKNKEDLDRRINELTKLYNKSSGSRKAEYLKKKLELVEKRNQLVKNPAYKKILKENKIPEKLDIDVKENRAVWEDKLKIMREEALKPYNKEQLMQEASQKEIKASTQNGVKIPETKPKLQPQPVKSVIGDDISVPEYKMQFEDSRELAERFGKKEMWYDDKKTYEENLERLFKKKLQIERVKQNIAIEDQIKRYKNEKGESIVFTKPRKGYVKITNNSSLNGFYIPKEAADMLDEYYKAFNPKPFSHPGAARFAAFWDKVNNNWKKIVTTYSPWTPGYGARNAVGDFINVLLGGFGGGNPARMYRSFEEGLEMMDFFKSIENDGLKKAMEKFGDKADDLLMKAKLIRKYSIISGKFSQLGDDLGRFTQDVKFRDAGNWWTRNVVGSLAWREDFMRVTNFLDKLNDHAPNNAARLAKQSSLDFAKMTNFERQGVKRLIPFYGFMKTNMEHQLSVLSKSHKPLLIQEKIFKNLKKVLAGGEITDEEWNNMPDWITDGMVIPISKNENGNVKLMSGFGEPTQALNELININSPQEFFFALASQVTPIIKFPIEMTTGYSAFKKQPIKEGVRGSFWKDFPLPLRKALGWKSGDKIAENGRVITTNTVHPYQSYALQTMPFISPVVHQARNAASIKNDPVSGILNLLGVLGGKIRERNVYADAKKSNEQMAQDLEDIISNMASQ